MYDVSSFRPSKYKPGMSCVSKSCRLDLSCFLPLLILLRSIIKCESSCLIDKSYILEYTGCYGCCGSILICQLLVVPIWAGWYSSDSCESSLFVALEDVRFVSLVVLVAGNGSVWLVLNWTIFLLSRLVIFLVYFVSTLPIFPNLWFLCRYMNLSSKGGILLFLSHLQFIDKEQAQKSGFFWAGTIQRDGTFTSCNIENFDFLNQSIYHGRF